MMYVSIIMFTFLWQRNQRTKLNLSRMCYFVEYTNNLYYIKKPKAKLTKNESRSVSMLNYTM